MDLCLSKSDQVQSIRSAFPQLLPLPDQSVSHLAGMRGLEVQGIPKPPDWKKKALVDPSLGPLLSLTAVWEGRTGGALGELDRTRLGSKVKEAKLLR